jgi:hypothetical protein
MSDESCHQAADETDYAPGQQQQKVLVHLAVPY